MCKDQRFFLCKHCGNLIGFIHSSGVPIVCCGENMTELIPNTSDGAIEKHVPQITINNNLVTVNIGSVDHPMIPEHYIEWIYLKTNQGGHRKCLESGMPPKVEFLLLDGEKASEAFAYCNLHGLWAAIVK